MDEATSALDSNNEGLVQDALDRAQKGRTTVVIAHRLITVLKATKIAVIVNGVIEEMGSHGVLMAKKGAYYSLIASQVETVCLFVNCCMMIMILCYRIIYTTALVKVRMLYTYKNTFKLTNK